MKRMPEDQHLEYKRELNDTLEKEVVAFLNHRDGGQIHIGIDDSGNLVGLADPDGDQLKIYYEGVGRPLGDQFASNLELLTDEGELNYAAYLLADRNGTSIKVAKYGGTDRVDLIESEEYGNCCLAKATHQVLDRLDLENRTLTRITSKQREEKRLYHPVALREAMINAIIHNDYSYEGVPKFELFADRLEITSTGGIPQGLSESEFFEGYSMPRAIEKQIAKLREEGCLRRVGPAKGGHWEVLGKDKG